MSILLPCPDPSCLVLNIPEVITDAFIENIHKSNIVYTSRFNKWYLTHILKIESHKIFACNFNQIYMIKNRAANATYNLCAVFANYAPGSALYVWKDDSGYTVYLGRFQDSRDIVVNPVIRNLIDLEVKKSVTVQVVDPDVTIGPYCKSPDYETTPEIVSALLRRELKNKWKQIVLSVPKFGFEKFLKKVAQDLKVTFHVDEARWKICSYLRLDSFFHTLPSPDQIEVKDLDCFSYCVRAKRATYSPGCRSENSLYIKIGSLDQQKLTKGKLVDRNNLIYFLPHKHYVSQEDLLHFFGVLKPEKVLGFPSSSIELMKTLKYTQVGNCFQIIKSNQCLRVLPKGVLSSYKTNPAALPKNLQAIFSHSPRTKSNVHVNFKPEIESFSGSSGDVVSFDDADNDSNVSCNDQFIDRNSKLLWRNGKNASNVLRGNNSQYSQAVSPLKCNTNGQYQSGEQSKLTTSNLPRNKVSVAERNKLMQNYLASESERLKTRAESNVRIGRLKDTKHLEPSKNNKANSVSKTKVKLQPESSSGENRRNGNEQRLLYQEPGALSSSPEAFQNGKNVVVALEQLNGTVKYKMVSSSLSTRQTKFATDDPVNEKQDTNCDARLSSPFRKDVNLLKLNSDEIVSEKAKLRLRQIIQRTLHNQSFSKFSVDDKPIKWRPLSPKELSKVGLAELPKGVSNERPSMNTVNSSSAEINDITRINEKNICKQTNQRKEQTSDRTGSKILADSSKSVEQKRNLKELENLFISGTPNLCPINCISPKSSSTHKILNGKINNHPRKDEENKDKEASNFAIPEKKKSCSKEINSRLINESSDGRQVNNAASKNHPAVPATNRKGVNLLKEKSITNGVMTNDKKHSKELSNLVINGTPNLCPVNYKSIENATVCEIKSAKSELSETHLSQPLLNGTADFLQEINTSNSSLTKERKYNKELSRLVINGTPNLCPVNCESEADFSLQKASVGRTVKSENKINDPKASKIVENVSKFTEKKSSKESSETQQSEDVKGNSSHSEHKFAKRKLEDIFSDSNSSSAHSRKRRKNSESSNGNSTDSSKSSPLGSEQDKASILKTSNISRKLWGDKLKRVSIASNLVSERNSKGQMLVSSQTNSSLKQSISNEFKSVLVRKVEEHFDAGRSKLRKNNSDVDSKIKSSEKLSSDSDSKMKLTNKPPFGSKPKKWGKVSTKEIENLAVAGTSKLCPINNNSDSANQLSGKLRAVNPEKSSSELKSSEKLSSDSDSKMKLTNKPAFGSKSKKWLELSVKEIENLAVAGTSKLCPINYYSDSVSQLSVRFKDVHPEKSSSEFDSKTKISDRSASPVKFTSSKELENLTVAGTSKLCPVNNPTDSDIQTISKLRTIKSRLEGDSKKPIKTMKMKEVNSNPVSSITAVDAKISKAQKMTEPKVSWNVKSCDGSSEIVPKKLDVAPLTSSETLSNFLHLLQDDSTLSDNCKSKESSPSSKISFELKNLVIDGTPNLCPVNMLSSQKQLTQSLSKERLSSKDDVFKLKFKNKEPKKSLCNEISSLNKKRDAELKKLIIDGTPNLCALNYATSAPKFLTSLKRSSPSLNTNSKSGEKYVPYHMMLKLHTGSENLENSLEVKRPKTSHQNDVLHVNSLYAKKENEAGNRQIKEDKLYYTNSEANYSDVKVEPFDELDTFKVEEDPALHFWDDLTGVDVTKLKSSRKSRRSDRTSEGTAQSSPSFPTPSACLAQLKSSPMKHFLSKQIKEDLIKGMRMNLSVKCNRLDGDKIKMEPTLNRSPSSPSKKLLKSPDKEKPHILKTLLLSPDKKESMKELKALKVSLINDPRLHSLSGPVSVSKIPLLEPPQCSSNVTFKPWRRLSGVKGQKAKRLTPFKTCKMLVDCLRENTDHDCNLDLSNVRERNPTPFPVKGSKLRSPVDKISAKIRRSQRLKPCSVVVEDIQAKLNFCRVLGLEMASLIPKKRVSKSAKISNFSFYKFPKRFKRWKRKPERW